MKSIAHTRLYLLYTSALVRAVRLLVIFLILFLLFYQFSHHLSVKLPLFFLIWYFIIEIFFHYSIYRYHPTLPLSKNNKDLLESSSLDILRAYLAGIQLSDCLYYLYRFPQIVFILEKIGVVPKDIPSVAIDKKQVLEYAAEIVKTVKGEYITSMDFIVAYLLLSENNTKLLFNHQIKQPELMNILQWARHDFQYEEIYSPPRVNFTGEGLGEELVNGWTLETKKYTTNFSYSIGDAKPFLIGREMQYKSMLETLSKRESNNVMLVGEPGVGKENLVMQLADDSYFGLLSPYLNHKKILELMVGPLIAGAQDRGDLELRLQAIIEEVSHAQNVLLYIPDFENLMGSTSYGLDVSGAILPYLKSGNLAIVASMTTGNYKTYLAENPLKNEFSIITISEPDLDTATQMLLAKSLAIEKANGVVLVYKTITAGVELADRYDQDDVLPGSAVTLLNDTANSVALSPGNVFFANTKIKLVLPSDIEAQIGKRTQVNVGVPSKKEKELLLHLEDKLHERVIDQVQAITAISEAVRRLRSGLTTPTRPISFLFLGPTGVGKTETAKALAYTYYGGANNMIRLDMSEYSDIDGERRLLGSAPGEGNERGELTDKIHDHPFSLVLLDEFEKATTKILDLFLQVLDDGRLTDNKGKTVSFVNSIIIATSNAGAELIREHLVSGGQIDKAFQRQILEYLQTRQILKPELINRFDDVVIFAPLGEAEQIQVVQLLLKDIIKQLAEQDLSLSFDDNVIRKIVTEGMDVEFGARPLRRYIQDHIEDIIAQKKLKDEIKRGDKLLVTVDPTGEIVIATQNESDNNTLGNS